MPWVIREKIDGTVLGGYVPTHRAENSDAVIWQVITKPNMKCKETIIDKTDSDGKIGNHGLMSDSKGDINWDADGYGVSDSKRDINKNGKMGPTRDVSEKKDGYDIENVSMENLVPDKSKGSNKKPMLYSPVVTAFTSRPRSENLLTSGDGDDAEGDKDSNSRPLDINAIMGKSSQSKVMGIKKLRSGKSTRRVFDFMTLLRKTLYVILANQGLIIREFISKDGYYIIAPLYLIAKNQRKVAELMGLNKQLDLAMTDMSSLEPVDEYGYPLRLNPTLHNVQKWDRIYGTFSHNVRKDIIKLLEGKFILNPGVLQVSNARGNSGLFNSPDDTCENSID